MYIKEAIENLFTLAVNNKTGRYEGSYEQAYDIIITELDRQETLIKKQQAELEKKDRIMKEMAGHIILMNDSRGLTNEEKIEYFTNKAENVGE